MSATLAFDSSWDCPIDLTSDDDSPMILTNGAWNGPQARLWEVEPIEEPEPARKRRRVSDSLSQEGGPRPEGSLEEPTSLSGKPPPPRETRLLEDNALPTRTASIINTNGPQSVPCSIAPEIPAAANNSLATELASARPRASAWGLDGSNADGDGDDPKQPPKAAIQSRWFKLSHRPYIDADQRYQIQAAIESKQLFSLGSETLKALPYTYHVDLSQEEVEYVWQEARALLPSSKLSRNPIRGIAKALRRNPAIARSLPEKIQGQGPVSTRDELDLYYFLSDVNNSCISQKPGVCTLRWDEPDSVGDDAQARSVCALLFRREVEGLTQFGRARAFGGIRRNLLRMREDRLELRTVWTNCAGDIASIAWVSDSAFVCGTTEHSDAHNQQYNKPGNLLLGSTSARTLRAFSDHRIVRPAVAKGENASDAMRHSQSPWLYSSVVSSAYDPILDIAYTSSFDKTVKAWKVDEAGTSMQLAGTWHHGGNVNFVVASQHDLNLVATAADVAAEAVRVYRVNPDKISSSQYFTFGGKISSTTSVPVDADVWAYYPATIQWGISSICSHHLLVGYSPRSLSGDDNDIPELKRSSGELRLFNAVSGGEISLGIPMCQNVFEVAWHPTRPVFIVAMTVGASKAESDVRTQIRVFALSTRTGNVTSTPFRPESSAFAAHAGGVPDEFYGFTMVLDCFSSDINELTINPNSPEYFYVTAACTDGRVFVWDTAQGHRPIHILCHGKPVEEYSGDREKEDTGSKFTAWGSTPGRLYTGGSDGVVKVWNVTHPRPFVRDLLEVSGPVSAGAFSPDNSKLAIGDASGRVYLLSVDEDDGIQANQVQLPLGGGVYNTTDRTRSVRRPIPYIPHPDPPPPPGYLDHSGVLLARNYLDQGLLVRHRNPVMGVFQGPNYLQMNLFRTDLHWEQDPSNPLLADAERNQQANRLSSRPYRGGIGSRFLFGRNRGAVVGKVVGEEAVMNLHRQNCEKDFDWEGLSLSVREELMQNGVDPRVEEDYGLEFEEDEEDEEDEFGEGDIRDDSWAFSDEEN